MNKPNTTVNSDFKGTIAVLNTVYQTVPMMKNSILEYLPNANVINFVDDSILPMIKEDPSTMEYSYEKFLMFAKIAEKQNASIIVNACSTVCGFKDYAKDKIDLPVLRIDEEVAKVIAQNSKRIAVLATMSTTVIPSTEIIRSKLGKDAVVDTFLLDNAAAFNAKGDKMSHDKTIAHKINTIGDEYDSIFLAQASMADGIIYASPKYTDNVYTSIPYAIDELVKLTLTLK